MNFKTHLAQEEVATMFLAGQITALEAANQLQVLVFEQDAKNKQVQRIQDQLELVKMDLPDIWEWPVFQTNDGYYRYVWHAEKLLTTGFKTFAKLQDNAPDIRVDTSTVKLMRQRYEDQFHD